MDSNNNSCRTGLRPAEHNPSTGIAPTSSGRVRLCPRRPGRIGRWLRTLAALLLVPWPASAAISLSHDEAMRIGRKIWQNECGATIAGLTSWNAGENFASLGIGHFIWYPAGVRGPFEESFPNFVRFAEKRGTKLPELLLGRKSGACPWNSRQEFLAAGSSKPMRQLRTFLADTVNLQADFLVERLREALPKMLATAPAAERSRIEQQFERVASSPQGVYALIDYVNFKGEGVLASRLLQTCPRAPVISPSHARDNVPSRARLRL